MDRSLHSPDTRWSTSCAVVGRGRKVRTKPTPQLAMDTERASVNVPPLPAAPARKEHDHWRRDPEV
jgi:hypothetical protein